MRVMDLTGREERFSLAISPGTLYELLVELCAYGLPEDWDTFELGTRWFENTRSHISTRLGASLAMIGPQAGKIWVNLLGLAVQPPALPDIAAFIHRIEALPPLDLRLHLLGAHVPAYRRSISLDVLQSAALGDLSAQEQLLEDPSYFGGEANRMLRPLLSLAVEETKALAVDILRGWHEEVFAPSQTRVAPILERDAAAKRALLTTLTQEALIEAASGIQYTPHPSIRQVYLIPQIAMRPWVLLCEHDDTRLFCYPVADDSLDGDPTAPPGPLVRVHKALGDEKRLRMLKALTARGATLQELADLFGLPKSTAHHHLAILRSAGLVRVTSDDERRYSVRREVLPETAQLLETYLEGGSK